MRRANTDGSEIEDLIVDPPFTPDAIALDLGAGKIYWRSSQNTDLRRSNLDGSNAETVLTTWAGKSSLVFDDSLGVLFASGNVVRIDPIALTVDVLYYGGLDGPTDLVIDAISNVMYWGGSSGIYRANLDGSNVTQVLDEINVPLHLALDAPNNMLYWTESFSDRIRRMSIGGTVIEDLVSGVDNFKDIAVDLEGARLYWTDAERIRRANLDGTNVEDLYTGTPGLPPSDLALDILANQMYWICPEMQRSKLDGSGVEILLKGKLFCLYDDIFIASVPRRIYWADAQNGSYSIIHRAETNIHAVSDLVTMPNGTHVTAIAFDCVPYRFGDFDLTGLVDLDDLIIILNGF
ncbi:MAG: hypothetical protein AABZ47_00540, partial [Planctomycetota bacterium]